MNNNNTAFELLYRNLKFSIVDYETCVNVIFEKIEENEINIFSKMYRTEIIEW